MKIWILWRGAFTFRFLCCPEGATSSCDVPAGFPHRPSWQCLCASTLGWQEGVSWIKFTCRWIRLPQKSHSRVGAPLPPAMSQRLTPPPHLRNEGSGEDRCTCSCPASFLPNWHHREAKFPHRCIHSVNEYLLNTSYWERAIKTGNKLFPSPFY